VRSVKEECLSKLILFGERSVRRALQQYVVHHEERNHQGKENLILFPLKREGARDRKAAVRCRERLGGLLKCYERKAA
jgi:putative transposase